MYRERIIRTGLILLAATTLACSTRENKTVTPAAKPGPTIPVPTPESITIPISIPNTSAATDCSKKGELMGLKPDIEKVSVDSAGNRVATTRMYFLRTDKRPDEGIISLAVEPRILLEGPILAVVKGEATSFSIGIKSLEDERAAVSGLITRGSMTISKFNLSFDQFTTSALCNFATANWKDYRFLGIALNNQSITHEEFRRQQSLLKI